MISNKIYDKLKWVVAILLPGIATLYAALSPIWNFPNQEGVVGTIVATSAFLGTLLGISTYKYNKVLKTEITRSEAPSDNVPVSSMQPELYNILKWATLIFLPALGTFYYTLSFFWNFPSANEIVSTITALTTFLGLLLGLSNELYKRS